MSGFPGDFSGLLSISLFWDSLVIKYSTSNGSYWRILSYLSFSLFLWESIPYPLWYQRGSLSARPVRCSRERKVDGGRAGYILKKFRNHCRCCLSLLELWHTRQPATGREKFRYQETVLNCSIPVSPRYPWLQCLFLLIKCHWDSILGNPVSRAWLSLGLLCIYFSQSAQC